MFVVHILIFEYHIDQKQFHKNLASFTNLSLDKVVALGAYVFEKAENINCALLFDLLQHAVYDDVRSRPTHSSTATQHSNTEEQQEKLKR